MKNSEQPSDNNKVEKCIQCGCDTEYTRNTPIDLRYHYIEGAGQLCKDCYDKTYE